jgi:AcrR family transcriptional regulator
MEAQMRGEVAELERDAIEAALIDEVVEMRYSSATIEGVCRRADVGREQFIRHFADLEDGYCEVLEALCAQIFGRLLAAFDGQETWRDQIRATGYAIYDYFDEDRERGRFMMVEVFLAGERAQRIRDEALAVLIDLIDQGRKELCNPGRLSRATAAALGGSIFHQVRGALERDDPDAEDLVPQLMYNVIQPYLGVEEARQELAMARERPAA